MSATTHTVFVQCPGRVVVWYAERCDTTQRAIGQALYNTCLCFGLGEVLAVLPGRLDNVQTQTAIALFEQGAPVALVAAGPKCVACDEPGTEDWEGTPCCAYHWRQWEQEVDTYLDREAS